MRKNESDTLNSNESTLKAKDRNIIISIINTAQKQISIKNNKFNHIKLIREIVKEHNINNILKYISNII